MGLMHPGRPYAYTLVSKKKYVCGTKNYEGKSLYRNVLTRSLAIYLSIGAPRYETGERKRERKRERRKN